MIAPAPRKVGVLASLHRYPVKSMLGEDLNASEIGEKGLAGDRRFALTDPATGKVASAKNPSKWPNLFDFRASYIEPLGRGAVPPVRITLPNGDTVLTSSDELDEVLSASLGKPVRFLHSARPSGTLEEYWPDIEGLPRKDEVTDEAIPPETFFDLAMVHLLTTATLAEMRRLYPEGRLEPRRFRPNLVVETLPELTGFAEAEWVDKIVRIGDEVELQITGPCPRCVMTTLAQGDLPKDNGVLRTAAKYNHAHVGVYASVRQGGLVRRGDSVRVDDF